MKASIQSTEQMIHINGIPARVWIGTTDSGIPIQLAITRVAVDKDADLSQFGEELQSTHAPKPAIPAFSLSMII